MYTIICRCTKDVAFSCPSWSFDLASSGKPYTSPVLSPYLSHCPGECMLLAQARMLR